ncbi:ATP-grasp fold amidoligase family protein [Frateuria sp. GZRe12]|uniref:ATP-grasp fold amidoligase family protein n=1 Tax=Frateuria sp. GZRe12 TaxID=3351533 RepID=UPI003EDC7966
MKILAPKKAIKRLFNSLPDAGFYQYKSLQVHGRFCNFRNPKRFSEKIFYRMRYPEPVFTMLADKVAARDYVARTIGSDYVVPAYLSCDAVTPETFDALPQAFVMKTSNGFGQVKIIRDKHQEDLAQLAALANGWLADGAASRSREKHYLSIPPKILFEKALLDGDDAPDDYKFNVFNASGQEPFVFIQHMHGRFRDLEQQLYLEDWSPAPFQMDLPLLRPSTGTTEKPQALPEMLALAKKLAQPFGYLRVDFYVHQGKVYVGELTVTPGAGTYVFTPKDWDRSLGERFGWPEHLAQA